MFDFFRDIDTVCISILYMYVKPVPSGRPHLPTTITLLSKDISFTKIITNSKLKLTQSFVTVYMVHHTEYTSVPHNTDEVENCNGCFTICVYVLVSVS